MHYNGENLFVKGTEIIEFKAKVLIVPNLLCLGNVLKDLSTDNMKKNGFYECVYDFSIDYDAIAVNNILDIHKYLMKKNSIR